MMALLMTESFLMTGVLGDSFVMALGAAQLARAQRTNLLLVAEEAWRKF